jgi:AcrR family transcriptional regulator
MFNKIGRKHRESEKARPANHDRTRSELLQVAGEVFGAVGYEAATIRRICRRARKNIALVKYHFGDKQGLYTAVLQESIRAARVEDLRSAIDQNAPPEEFLRILVKARLRMATRQDLPSWYFRIMMHEFLQPTPAMKRMVDEVSRPMYDRVREVIGAWLGLSPDDEKTRLCVNSVFGQVFLYAFPQNLFSQLWPDLKLTPAHVKRIADHIASFSVSYIREQSTSGQNRDVRETTEANPITG